VCCNLLISRTHAGLLHMLHHKFYLDAFTLHDQSNDDPGRRVLLEMMYGKQGKVGQVNKSNVPPEAEPIIEDTRRDLDRTWARSCRFQPLWKIRNYFGEKIALYFAWCGTLILTLWLPMLFGIAVFLYGLYLRYIVLCFGPT
jgi:Calcium-activated chloride channel